MDIETSLNVYDYPSPPEEKIKRATGYVTVTYRFDDEFPSTYTDEDIKSHIERYAGDYDEDCVNIQDISIEEV